MWYNNYGKYGMGSDLMDEFDKLINEAVRKSLIAEYEQIPPREELEKMYTFSDRFNQKMKENFPFLFEKENEETK